MASDKVMAQVCGELIAAFPNFPLTRETIATYGRALADIPDAALRAAAAARIASGRFFPSVSELRASAEGGEGYSLRRAAVQLHDAFYRDGTFNRTEWEEVAGSMERQGRAVAAASVRAEAAMLGSSA